MKDRGCPLNPNLHIWRHLQICDSSPVHDAQNVELHMCIKGSIFHSRLLTRANLQWLQNVFRPLHFFVLNAHIYAYRNRGRYGSGGKSCRLAVGGLPVWSHPGHVEVSLSKTPNPDCSWRAGWCLAWQPINHLIQSFVEAPLAALTQLSLLS